MNIINKFLEIFTFTTLFIFRNIVADNIFQATFQQVGPILREYVTRFTDLIFKF